MNGLEKQLKDMIRLSGPVNVATFMDLALRHYYSTRDPFGVKGDFTTAPEISQIFGEMIAIFLADAWVKMRGPSNVLLVEAGPGRGTLMADVLRPLRKMTELYEQVSVHLIEMSPVLKQKQADTLKDYNVQWHETLDTVPQDGALFFVANEFLDALPIRQYQFIDRAWHERVVGLGPDDRLVFGVSPGDVTLNLEGKDGDIFEAGEARERFVGEVGERLQKQGGVALFIDYGHDRTGVGDTLQAVKDHQYTDVLSHVGEADLTSHVDFGALAATAGKAARGPVGQGLFLKHMGIEERAQKLNQMEELRRLTADDQMGRLFRVMALCHDEQVRLAGFS